MKKALIILSLLLSSCLPEVKTITQLHEMADKGKAIKKETKVTGVFLGGYKYNYIYVKTEAGIEFYTNDDRIDKFKQGDVIHYFVDSKTGGLLGNILQ